MINDFIHFKKTFIIAEIGVNHEGNISLAKEMIQLAKESGADAVKFQTYLKDEYIAINQKERFDRAQRFCLNFDQFRELAEYAKKHQIIFFSTPLDITSIDFLDELSPLFKISSGDLTNDPLIEKAATKKKPLILSTGLASENEIVHALSLVKKVSKELISTGKLMLMHCVSSYPTPVEEANLKAIHFLKKRFKLPVGYSDHTLGIKACEIASALGAIAVEKHFTYKKEGQIFHDHQLSADPCDFKQLVTNIREIEKLLGKEAKGLLSCEDKFAVNMRRSLGTRVFLKQGATIKKEDLILLRPALGVLPKDIKLILGKKIKRDIQKGELIFYEDLC